LELVMFQHACEQQGPTVLSCSQELLGQRHAKIRTSGNDNCSGALSVAWGITYNALTTHTVATYGPIVYFQAGLHTN
ncbi:MAG: hypothetical protein ACKPKO_12920, partial [Candidatus Fonsibacter sp.]